MDYFYTNVEPERYNITDISNVRYHINIVQTIRQLYTEFPSVYNIYTLYRKYSIYITLIIAICAFASISRFPFSVFGAHSSKPRFLSAV